jgi:hypothetical protein
MDADFETLEKPALRSLQAVQDAQGRLGRCMVPQVLTANGRGTASSRDEQLTVTITMPPWAR